MEELLDRRRRKAGRERESREGARMARATELSGLFALIAWLTETDYPLRFAQHSTAQHRVTLLRGLQ